ncbi:hypothetical protein AB0L53_34245 [Nonomuraea sp. NPDC052129]|uniref:hypothetical protein n=1 Tax=Nonomuraea sp. NPDC052129 TaxID=3154651 RepID=UPI0034155235
MTLLVLASEPDILARGLAVAALLVSAIGVLIAWRTYEVAQQTFNRAAPRLTMSAEFNGYACDVTIRNHGAALTRVTSIDCWAYPAAGDAWSTCVREMTGRSEPVLPHPLDGFQQVEWTVSRWALDREAMQRTGANFVGHLSLSARASNGDQLYQGVAIPSPTDG